MPVEVAAGLVAPSALALTATHIYWMDVSSSGGNLRRIAKNGGTVETLYTSGDPSGLDIYNNQIYWSMDESASAWSHLLRANLDGTGTIDFVAPVQGSMGNVQVTEGIAYWSEYSNTSRTYTVFRKAVTGTSAPEPVVSDISDPVHFAWAGNCLYYARGGSNGFYRMCDRAVSLFSGWVSLNPHSPSDTSMFYFGAQGGVMRTPLAAFQQATLVVAGTSVWEPLIDGNFIYFIDGDPGSAPACTTNWNIKRSGKTPGTTATTLVPAPLDCPSGLIDDAEALYWRESTTIRKIAKP